MDLRSDMRLAALEVNGLAYGALPLSPDAWRPIVECYAEPAVRQRPLELPSLQNFSELAVLRIRPAIREEALRAFFSLDLRRWQPQIGETILALGFPNLDRTEDGQEGNADDSRPISQYLHGSFARVVDVEHADPTRGRSWPQMRVDAQWPGGMSGGPVFNENGHVVGLVSTSFAGAGAATATYFHGWPMPQRLLGNIDPDNPGWFFCYAVFDSNGVLVRCGQGQQEIARFATDHGMTDLGVVTMELASGNYLRIDS